MASFVMSTTGVRLSLPYATGHGCNTGYLRRRISLDYAALAGRWRRRPASAKIPHEYTIDSASPPVGSAWN